MGFVGIHTMISENEEREKRRGFGAERNVRGYQHLRKMKIYKRKSEGVIREVGGKSRTVGCHGKRGERLRSSRGI